MFCQVYMFFFFLQLFTTGILRVCLREMLGHQQRSSLFKLLKLLEQLFSSTTDMNNIIALETQWHQALAEIERDFPASLQVFTNSSLFALPALYRGDIQGSLSVVSRCRHHKIISITIFVRKNTCQLPDIWHKASV